MVYERIYPLTKEYAKEAEDALDKAIAALEWTSYESDGLFDGGLTLTRRSMRLLRKKLNKEEA